MEMQTIARKRGVWVEIASELYQIQTQRKALEDKESMLKQRLRDLSEDKPSQGSGYLFTVSFRKGGIKYEDIPMLKGMDLEPYRKTDIAIWKLQKMA